MKLPGQFGLQLDLTSKSDYQTFIKAWYVANMAGGDPSQLVNGDFGLGPDGKPRYRVTIDEFLTLPQGSSGWIWNERYWPEYQLNKDPQGQPVVELGAALGTDSLASSQVYGSDTAAATVRGYLQQNYPLPAGWSYDVRYYEIHTVDTNTLLPSGSYAANDQYVIEAKATKPGRADIPAGKNQIDPKLYGYDVAKVWRLVAEGFPSVARPVYMNTAKQCFAEDALKNPQIQTAGSPGPPAATVGPTSTSPFIPIPVPVAQPDQGVSSEGQAPWDSQPDVVDPDAQIKPGITGTVVGAGYTGTIKSTISGEVAPDGYLDWLNLTIPDAAKVMEIRKDLDLTEQYLEKFRIWRASITPTQGLPGTTNPVVTLPNPYSYQKLEPIDFANPPQLDGVGFTPAQMNLPGGGTSQLAPSNYFDTTQGSQGSADEFGDNVQLMLELNSTDFLNMLALQYRETLTKIAGIPAARSQVNELVDAGRMDAVELFLRDFDASAYATAPVVKTTTPEAEQKPKMDTTTLLIGLGLIAGLYFISQKKAYA